ncbi:MAG: hypothetical protein WCO79_03370 [bacterium]
MNKTRIIWTSVGVVVVIAGGFLSTQSGTVPTIGLGGMSDIEAQGGKVEIEALPTSSAAVLPDIHHKAAFTAKMVPEAKAIILKNIFTLQEKLSSKVGQENFATWNSLAQNYQVAEDYAAARDVWEYLGKVFPSNHVAYGNLGFLYGYYLKDVVRAEQNYLKAIQNAPSQAFLYFQTAEFYRDVLKNSEKALAIAQKGLTNNPQNADLRQLVQSLQQK